MTESRKDRVTPTADGRKPLLELSTLAPEHPYLTIDGERYELALVDDFGLIEQARFERVRREVEALRIGERDLDEEGAEHLDGLLRQMVAMVVPSLPDEISDKLSDYHRLSIIESFMEAAARTPGNRVRRRSRRQTGAKSSRGSSASTVAARKTG